ncbi:MAG TPA: protease complex subunit PrcB family protein, partial [Symbiobacteriaceae bacterium]|nr:protease complex subunit PrcB family protein [Symbiobacteriaceae bacterium]
PVLRPLAFSSVSKGSYSGVAERKAVLLTDAAQWNQHWQVHSAHQVPVPPAPAADFSQSALLAVYMGEQTSGGHSITVTDVQEENGKLIVTVKQTAPGPNSIVTMALTQPYHIVRIPAVSKDTRVEVNWQ